MQRVVMAILEPVKSAHFVGAVVGTVTSADTPVVSLLVESFVAMDGGQYGANRFAWGVVTVLTHHRLMVDFDVVCKGVIGKTLVRRALDRKSHV